jgi:hypothetical protein
LPLSNAGGQLFEISLSPEKHVIRECHIRPNEHIILDAQPIPNLHTILDCHTIANEDIVFNKTERADIAVGTDRRSREKNNILTDAGALTYFFKLNV